MFKYQVSINGKTFNVDLIQKQGSQVAFVVDGQQYSVDVAPIISQAQSATPQTIVSTPAPANTPQVSDNNSVTAPMPGIVVSIAVEPGQTVKAGDTLLVIEAMKMENNIQAPRDAAVKEVHIAVGDELDNNQLLISLD